MPYHDYRATLAGLIAALMCCVIDVISMRRAPNSGLPFRSKFQICSSLGAQNSSVVSMGLDCGN